MYIEKVRRFIPFSVGIGVACTRRRLWRGVDKGDEWVCIGGYGGERAH